MNIIIPLGGLGDRFKQEGYISPKPLIKILGKEMILHIIDNLKLVENDTIYIIYNPELEKFGFNEILNRTKLNIKFIKLYKQTEGAAETILIGLAQSIDLTKKCVLLDCDTFYNIDIISIYRRQNTNSVFCFMDNQDKAIFSYIKFDDNNIISQIKEKKKISIYANTGCYCFQNGTILKNYCQKIINNNTRQNGEYYMSCVIESMLDDGHIFIANIISQNDFHCVGTPMQLKMYCTNHIGNTKKMRICFDLDGTLVTNPTEHDNYASVLPINKNIEYLRYLKNLGHEIIIHTARRMRTHHSNVGKIIKDVGIITLEKLEEFNIPYDEIYFGKPWADFYIDDRALNVYHDLEKEIGIYNTEIKERSFNHISTTNMEIIIKKGNMDKLKGEIHWYKNIPATIMDLFPIFIKDDHESYMIEKINGIGLSYIYLKESMTPKILLDFLAEIDRIHNSISVTEKINVNCNYVEKLVERYQNYDYTKYSNHQIIYNDLLDFFGEYKGAKIGVIHGDPVFSNVIMTKDMKFKFIDMRGKQGDECTIFGDIFYDYAKIYQSLIGYDEILLDKILHNNYKTQLISVFEKYIIDKFDDTILKNIKFITASLLFTLIPLHDNDKCMQYYQLINY